MHLITVLLRIALSGVFGVAGVTKLIDPRWHSRRREKLRRTGSTGLASLPEFCRSSNSAIAVGLLFTDTSRISALAALLVLILFIVAISVNLARGHTHDCHCFGQLYSRPTWLAHARAQHRLRAGRGLCVVAVGHKAGFRYCLAPLRSSTLINGWHCLVLSPLSSPS